jgi:hypothetical protein
MYCEKIRGDFSSRIHDHRVMYYRNENPNDGSDIICGCRG